MPASVAPEGFETRQGFIALPAPELARALEAALGLPAGRFHRPAAAGFTAPLSAPIVHARFVLVKIIHLPRHGFDGTRVRQSGQRLFQLADNLDGWWGLQRFDQRFEPRFE